MTEVNHESLLSGQARVRVRYAETDQMGVVYHANYLVWFEVGRVELMRQSGLNYTRMETEEGCGIAVVDVRIRYKAPARYDDLLLIQTHVAKVRGSVVHFRYTIVRESDGTMLCEGETVHIVVGRDMKRRTMPQRYVDFFHSLESASPG
jgi:acyl-CoA thioester hydrolase